MGTVIKKSRFIWSLIINTSSKSNFVNWKPLFVNQNFDPSIRWLLKSNIRYFLSYKCLSPFIIICPNVTLKVGWSNWCPTMHTVWVYDNALKTQYHHSWIKLSFFPSVFLCHRCDKETLVNCFFHLIKKHWLTVSCELFLSFDKETLVNCFMWVVSFIW